MLDPSWVSFWTACQALLLLANLLVVGWYLLETRKLRIAAQRQLTVSQNQLEAQIRPALELIVQAGQLWFENLGTGPALDARAYIEE